jgi:hypothetical protein
MVVLVGGAILGPVIVRQMRKIREPVAGTARVLSVRKFGSIAVNGPEREIYRFRLRVASSDLPTSWASWAYVVRVPPLRRQHAPWPSQQRLPTRAAPLLGIGLRQDGFTRQI